MRGFAKLLAIVVVMAGVVAAAPQVASVSQSKESAFLGTWTVTMTSPDEMKGRIITVFIGHRDGRLAVSVQTQPDAPASEATGVLLDGALLIASIGHHAQRPMTENGAPIWATFTLTLDGDTLKLAQTLERSVTIKRGQGGKQ